MSLVSGGLLDRPLSGFQVILVLQHLSLHVESVELAGLDQFQ